MPSAYVVDLVTPDGDVRVPVSSWQATLQTEGASYAQCVIPACEPYILDIAAATEFVVSHQSRSAGGDVLEETEILRGPAETYTFDRGAYRYTATLSGYADEEDLVSGYDDDVTSFIVDYINYYVTSRGDSYSDVGGVPSAAPFLDYAAREIETAYALVPVQRMSAALASETNLAVGGFVRPAGLAVETDTAYALSGSSRSVVGMATETDEAFAMSPGVASDADYASRSLILNLTVDNTDHSTYAATITATGSPTNDPTDGLELDGSTQLLRTPDASRWTLGTTSGIELKGVVFNTISAHSNTLFAQYDTGTGGTFPLQWFYVNNSGHLGFLHYNGTPAVVTNLIDNDTPLTTGVPYDIVLKRTAGTMSFHVDGATRSVTGTNGTGAFTDVPDELSIFSFGGADRSACFDGTCKGVRFSNGVTPSTAGSMPYPFPTS